MNDTMRAIKFFYLYLKKYKLQFVIIMFFIIVATYLQVRAPAIMGEAITNLTTYVEKFFAHQRSPEAIKILKKISDNAVNSQETLKQIATKLSNATGHTVSWHDLTNNNVPQQLHRFLPKGTTINYLQQIATIPHKWRMLNDGNVPTTVIASLPDGTSINNLHKLALSAPASKGTFLSSMWLLLTFYVMIGIAQLFYTLLFARIVAHSTNNMRKGLFGKLEHMTIDYFDRHEDGNILSRFTSDLDNIQNTLNQSAVNLITNFALFIGISIMIFNKNVTLAWVIVSTTPIAVIVAVIIMIQARRNTDRQQAEVSDLNAYMDEKISGQKSIIVEGQQEDTINGFLIRNKKVQKSTFAAQAWSGMIMPVMNGFQLITTALVIFIGTRVVLNDSDMSTAVGLGLIVAFIQYAQQYYNPIIQISSSFGQLQLAITGATRLNEMFDGPEESRPESGKIFEETGSGIQIKHVNFGYISDHQILKDININVNMGDMVALVGPTGSGKTTIMNLMNRFYDVDSGYIKYNGIDIRKFDLDSLRSKVGIVFQESVLFSGTIAGNIAFGKPTATMDEIVAVAKTTQINEFIESLPDKYETLVNESNDVFSVGQKQQISIARTILTDPKILILDEATANVDTVTEQKIQYAMDAAIVGRTSLVIAHRLKTVLNANKIVVLKDGKVLEEGTHNELLQKNGFYSELYHDQFIFE